MDAELKRKETADLREERREKKERQIQNQKEKKRERNNGCVLLQKKEEHGKEHAKTEDPHEDVGKLEKDGNKAIVMIKPLQQTNKSHEDSSGDGGTNLAGIWFN
ncbi:hypothetical protein Tco_1493196 [Tanacetum coccineum]